MTQRSAQSARSSTTSVIGLVHDQLRRMRSLTRDRQRNERVRQLAKDELTRHTAKAVERVRALVIDAVDRGAPIEECEEVLQLLLADVRHEYALKHGEAPALSLADAHQLEQSAEGEKNAAETAFAYAQTAANATRLLIACARHQRADDVYTAIVRSRELAVG